MVDRATRVSRTRPNAHSWPQRASRAERANRLCRRKSPPGSSEQGIQDKPRRFRVHDGLVAAGEEVREQILFLHRSSLSTSNTHGFGLLVSGTAYRVGVKGESTSHPCLGSRSRVLVRAASIGRRRTASAVATPVRSTERARRLNRWSKARARARPEKSRCDFSGREPPAKRAGLPGSSRDDRRSPRPICGFQ